jgi:AcrR family transcriptional regulator
MTLQNLKPARSTQKGAKTRAEILDAAARLFAIHGFEATTFTMIGKASGAANGSIMHSFHDKADIARIVYAGAMGRLVSAVTSAVDRRPTDVLGTIHAVISACFSWAEANPGDDVLLRALNHHVGPYEEIGIQARLEPLIAAWAQPLIRAGLLQPLVPAQLYAVMIAPAICGAVASDCRREEREPPEIEWASVLSAAAIAAVQPLSPKARTTPAKLGDPTPSKQRNLL